jgi:uncharacterized protein YdeI (YjbR/CyaY-like superfamily)
MSASVGTPGGTPEQPAIFFRDAEEFGVWLAANHDTAPELWMGLHKRHVPDRGLQWADAVVEALRFGWIDSKAERIDDDARRQRWTPRRPGSIWSVVNLATVERLIAEGRMEPAGLAVYEARREDRSGVYAYEQGEAELPSDAAARLAANPAAQAFWDAAIPSYRKLASRWVTSAKQAATRERRLDQLIECCATGQLIPTQRYGAPPTWLTRAAAAAAAVR